MGVSMALKKNQSREKHTLRNFAAKSKSQKKRGENDYKMAARSQGSLMSCVTTIEKKE